MRQKPCDCANVEEVLAVFAQRVPWRLVYGLQVEAEGVAVGAEQAAEMAAALLRVEHHQLLLLLLLLLLQLLLQ